MSNLIYKLFNRGVKWNALEGVVYQSILTCHQILLFTVTGNLQYGLIGVLFSLLYLSILAFNFGFDKSLPNFYHLFIKNKSSFNKIFATQFFIQIFLLLAIFFAVVLFADRVSFSFISKFITDINILIVLALLLLTESVKKTLRITCELVFLNKLIALTEIFLIIIYVGMFWSGYFYWNKIDLFLVFIPHLIQSFIGIIIYSYFVIFKIYRPLPHDKEIISASMVKQLLFNRFTNYLNQLSHLLFSGNFIIPFLSSIYGLEKISIFKLLNIISVYFTVILERTFGLTSGALLSHLQDLSKNVKQAALNLATSKLVIVLYGVLIFLLFNFQNFFYSSLKITEISWLSLYLFLFAIIFENLFITMEQFFIVEGKIYYFVIINLLAGALFYIPTNISSLPLSIILLYLIIIRILSFIVLRKILKKNLNINLNYAISLNYIIYFILFAVLFLFMVKFLISFRS